MDKPLLTDPDPVHRVDRHSVDGQPSGSIVATDDDELIRRWASHRGAEPATGEATVSGPATVDVKDEGAGVRFNFPGAARFRPISWEEWFDNLHRYRLLFVYQRDDPSATYRLIPRGRLMGE